MYLKHHRSTLYQTTSFLDWTKFKVFADDNSNVAKIKISLFDMVEYTMEKGKKNAGYQQFLLFPVFSTDTAFGVVKISDCVLKG